MIKNKRNKTEAQVYLMAIKLNLKHTGKVVTEGMLSSVRDELSAAYELLHTNRDSAPGNGFHGWLTLPEDYDKEEFSRIKSAAQKIRAHSDAFVVVGIGGSYLGARAVIEACISANYNILPGTKPKIFFIGNSFSSNTLVETLDLLKDLDFSVNIISKSGTTTEPAIAFRFLRNLLNEKYGEEGAKDRIFVTTDRSKGKLKEMADKKGYEEFVVPDNVGGRYSVLTAVGLLPIAVAGVDIDALMTGARDAMHAYDNPDVLTNDVCRYAGMRNLLYRSGKKIESSTCFEPDYAMMNEWFKQLFGESEGKQHKGIFPTSTICSTDLHSLGQYIQDGERSIFETVVFFREPMRDLTVGFDESNVDGLNYLVGKTVSHINRRAQQATVIAHEDGDVPNIIIELPRRDAYNIGWLIYFFEKACAVSGYMLGVNPFDQPGVEDYKTIMFVLLGKPGYENLKPGLDKRLED